MKNKIEPKTIWAEVLKLLETRTKFNSWSIASGWLDTEFELKIINHEKIELVATQDRGSCVFTPATFINFIKHWGNYKAGKISRPELKKISRHATYILPILKLIEDGE